MVAALVGGAGGAEAPVGTNRPWVPLTPRGSRRTRAATTLLKRGGLEELPRRGCLIGTVDSELGHSPGARLDLRRSDQRADRDREGLLGTPDLAGAERAAQTSARAGRARGGPAREGRGVHRTVERPGKTLEAADHGG